jgi:hypothetical protein
MGTYLVASGEVLSGLLKFSVKSANARGELLFHRRSRG